MSMLCLSSSGSSVPSVVEAPRDHKSFRFADPEEGYFSGCRNFGFHSYLPGVPLWTILLA
jgi:hypothetical protein